MNEEPGEMKTALFMVVFLAAALMAAPASACSDCSSAVERANCCSKRIFEISTVLKHRAPCDYEAHQCAIPWFPDCPEPCIELPCHESPVYCDIDREICLEPPCHRPAFAMRPVECCLCGIELTGTKDLIVVCDGCSSHD